jgi:hypothetical protein
MQQPRRRSGIISGLLALGLLTGAALTVGPAQAVEAPGPYYAEPAWDRKMGVANRFVVLTNWNSAAVLDKETGLVWEKTPALTTHAWAAARLQCTARETGNRKGWRLPSVHELASLVDPANSTPSLPTGHPFTIVQSSFYWSASTFAEDPTVAWAVVFFNGLVGNTGKANDGHAWCVRGGMNADAY